MLLLGALFCFELLSILPASGFFHLPELGLSLFHFMNSTVLGIDTATASTSNVHVTFNPDNTFTSFLQIESIGQGLYTYASL